MKNFYYVEVRQQNSRPAVKRENTAISMKMTIRYGQEASQDRAGPSPMSTMDRSKVPQSGGLCTGSTKTALINGPQPFAPQNCDPGKCPGPIKACSINQRNSLITSATKSEANTLNMNINGQQW